MDFRLSAGKRHLMPSGQKKETNAGSGFNRENDSRYEELLADGYIFLADRESYEVRSESGCAAKIGKLGYSYLAGAKSAAVDNDSEQAR